jgi:hypothetical protein
MPLGRIVAVLGIVALAAPPAAVAVCGNGVLEAGEQCDDGGWNGTLNSCCSLACVMTTKRPDVIVGDLSGTLRLGTQGGITAYAVGTHSCNIGSCWLNWMQDTPDHPVIGQNMFRLKDGRMEQIGQSWLKHGFAALQLDLCGQCQEANDFTHLGVSCSDPYDAGLNAAQSTLGPKSAVNPTTGVFPYPDPSIGTTGDVLYKRLQVRNADLDPQSNVGALYFVEGQYVTRDDAAAGNQANNASYRKVLVGASPFNLTLDGPTFREQPGIHAWKATDPSVTETPVQVDGRFVLSGRATSLGGGLYHYEYALQNLTSHRAARSFTVPIPPGTLVTNVGFHDVDYHSGEPYDGTDWTATMSDSAVTWTTDSFASNPNANALRWGTLYNFRFDADVAPGMAGVSIGMFRPGTPGTVQALNVTPGSCTQAPAEVGASLRLSKSAGATTLTWELAPGSAWSAVLRGGLAFLPVGPGGAGDESCLGSVLLEGSVTDPVLPQPGAGFWYLVRGGSACGAGPWGFQGVNGSPGASRITTSCP